MSEFYVGQKVLCIAESNIPTVYPGILGEVYTICKVDVESPYERLFFIEIPNSGASSHRFVDAIKYLHEKDFKERLSKCLED